MSAKLSIPVGMLTASTLLFLAGCEPTIQTRYIEQELSRPERPVLPKIKAKELECVDQATYQKLYDRQRLITEYAITLETIIDATKHAPNDKNVSTDTHQSESQ